MSSYTDLFNTGIQSPSNVSYKHYNLTNNVQLNWPSSYTSSPDVTANIIDVTASVGPFNMILPTAREVSVGQNILFNNIGANSFNITLFGNINPVTLDPGESILIYLRDNSTPPGTWGISTSPGTPSVTSITLTSLNNNFTVNGSNTATITSAGTFTVNLANDLKTLSEFGVSTGFSSRTALNTWNLRTFVGTANQIIIDNPQGIAGNPVFSLSPVIAGINDATIGNIRITGNTISTVNSNGNLLLSPNGSGNIEANGTLYLGTTGGVRKGILFENDAGNGAVGFIGGNCAPSTLIRWVLPLVDGLAGQVMAHTGVDSTLVWANAPLVVGATTINAVARYSNVSGSLKNSGVIINDDNNVACTSATIGNVSISGNSITNNTFGDLSLIPLGGDVTVGALKYPTVVPSITGSVLQSQSPGVVEYALYHGKNLLKNSRFNINQRLSTTPLTMTGNIAYGPDCWQIYSTNAATSGRFQAIQAVGTTTGLNKELRCQRTAGNSGTNAIGFVQSIPPFDAFRAIDGGNLSLSFDLDAGANFSANNNEIIVEIIIGTGTTNVAAKIATLPGTGFTGQTVLNTYNIQITPVVYKYVISDPIPNNTTQIAVNFYYIPVGTAGANDYFSITNVQLEQSSNPTPLEIKTTSEDLLECQRFFCKSFAQTQAPGAPTGINSGPIMTVANKAAAVASLGPTVNFPTTMLAIPVITLYNPVVGNNQVRDNTAAVDCSASTAANVSDSGFIISYTGDATTVIGNYLYFHYSADASLYA